MSSYTEMMYNPITFHCKKDEVSYYIFDICVEKIRTHIHLFKDKQDAEYYTTYTKIDKRFIERFSGDKVFVFDEIIADATTSPFNFSKVLPYSLLNEIVGDRDDLVKINDNRYKNNETNRIGYTRVLNIKDYVSEVFQ